MAKLKREPERPSYAAVARSNARAEIPRFLAGGILAGLLAFLLPAAAAVAVYYFAEQGRMAQALHQLQEQAEYLAALIDPAEHIALKSTIEDTNAYNELAAPLQKAREFSPAWGRLLTGRYQNGKVAFILEAGKPREIPQSMRAPEEAQNLATVLANDDLASGDRIILTEDSILQQNSLFLSAIVPIGNPRAGTQDFLYLETSRAPLEEELALAQDARNMALVAAALLGAVTCLTVCIWRYRTFIRQATAVNKVRESEALFRSTYELSPVAMYLAGTNGRIIRANRAFCQFLGYSESELLRLLPSDYTREARQPLESPASDKPASQQQVEHSYRRQDGRQVWGLVSTAVVRDAWNEISHCLVQVVDITERKMVEETLRLSEGRLTFAADAGRVGMWDYDIKSGEVVWNMVMHQIHQTEAETFTATFDIQREFILEEDREIFTESFRKCLKEGRPFSQEYRITSRNGDIRHLKTRALFLKDAAGKPARAVGTAIDVSVEKAEAAELIRTREAALAADRAKSEFLAMMSHEIRTPLNGVLGFASMLKATPLNPEQLGYLETMESSGGRLINLVNDILDLSKIEAGEIKIEPVTFAIRPFLHKIHEQFLLQAREKNLHYELFTDESVPEALHADPQRLGQILTNLLGNAVKFTTKGHVRFRVKTLPQAETLEWHFSVEDTGPGISPEAMPRLFQAFYQVDSSNTRRHGGTGLGLAISRRFAKRMNGQLVLRSELEYGSEFTFILPVPTESPVPPNTAPASPNHLLNAACLAGKRVLVVEDNAVNRKLCGLQLKRLGCQIEFAETGLAAITRAREEQFDIILMDIQLPDLDGYDATRQIRAHETPGTHMPIIALTANAMPEDRAKCLEAGMDDFLSKPLQYETLAETLSRWV